MGEIGDGEGSGGTGEGHAGGGSIGDILRSDDAGGRGIDLDRRGGMIFVHPEHAKLLLGRGQVGAGVLLAVIGNIHLAF